MKRISEKVSGIIEKLRQHYPDPKLELEYSNPFELLIAVILSAQCTDDRVNKVTKALFRKFGKPGDFLKLSDQELEELIRPTGYYRQKAKNIKACCEKLVAEYGGEVPASIDDLVRLPGVGRKTAAMVIGNAFGINEGIAVDTHVKRVVQRLGLTESKTPEKIERDLMEIIQREHWTWFSNAVILHGRYVCTARNPKCEGCCLSDLCDYFANKN